MQNDKSSTEGYSISMETHIREAIRNYKTTQSCKDFNTVYDYCFPIFRFWYRHVQRFVEHDRATLLSEFQLIVLRAIRKFNPESPVADGFIRYFRAAAKKHAFSLRRETIGVPDVYGFKKDWEVVDPKGQHGLEDVDVRDLIDASFNGKEKQIVTLKLGGDQSSEVQSFLKLSDFQYRTLVRNIKENRHLQKAISRD